MNKTIAIIEAAHQLSMASTMGMNEALRAIESVALSGSCLYRGFDDLTSGGDPAVPIAICSYCHTEYNVKPEHNCRNCGAPVTG